MVNIEKRKCQISDKFKALAVPIDNIKFSIDNFYKLFPKNEITTPIETVIVYRAQFDKLEKRDKGGRKYLLGAMRQTLTDPIVIVRASDNPKKSLYMKSFNNCRIIVMSVVEHKKGGKTIAISTHQKNLKNILSKIKNPGDILYEKECPGSITISKTDGEAGGNGNNEGLADNGDNHLNTLSP
jgi:hypothetical protein